MEDGICGVSVKLGSHITYAKKLRRWAHRRGYSYFEEDINEQQEDMIVNLHSIEVHPHLWFD